MKTILIALAACSACGFSSCTTHEYPPTVERTVYVPAPKKKVYTPAPRVRVDSPETTTVVRPEE